MGGLSVNNPGNRMILITGIMAAGKSTVAQLLAEQLPGSVHLRGDVFRKMIVSGRADKSPESVEEAEEQLALRYRLAAQAADTYFQSGFNVVVQDVILGDWLNIYVNSIQSKPLHVIVLSPSEDEVSRRDQERSKTGYGEWSVPQLNHILQSETPRIGLWLDSSKLTVQETVEQIIRYLNEREG